MFSCALTLQCFASDSSVWGGSPHEFLTRITCFCNEVSVLTVDGCLFCPHTFPQIESRLSSFTAHSMLQLLKYCCADGLSLYAPLDLYLPKYASKRSWLKRSLNRNFFPGKLSSISAISVKDRTVAVRRHKEKIFKHACIIHVQL